jgi:aryl-alcohol dehydrogenase-like predicted oxidoreductase
VHGALGDAYGTPAQTALRFVLGNRDIATRVVGFTSIAQLSEAVEAVALGPLPTAAISKLDGLWANAFQNG